MPLKAIRDFPVTDDGILYDVDAFGLGDELFDRLPDDFRREYHHDDGSRTCDINPERVTTLADMVVHICAALVSSLIDAGSEREAVMEDEDLYSALCVCFAGWTGSMSDDGIAPELKVSE
jgi:hypothetical protein